MKIECMVLGAVATNCYFVINEETKETIVLDPAERLLVDIDAHDLELCRHLVLGELSQLPIAAQLGMDDVFIAVQSDFLHGKPTLMNRIFLDFTMRIALKYVT